MAGRVLIGTASWTDHAPFYPTGVRGKERLAWYARHFGYVEIDSSFYHIPTAKVTTAWAETTPPEFIFGIKAHRSMTLHERKEGKVVPATDQQLSWFESALKPLRDSGKLGAILYQWPPWFKPTPANFDLLVQARERHPDDQVAIEFRNREWGAPETWERVVDLLSEARLTYCCVDEPQLGSGSMSGVVVATTPQIAMLRMHGRNAHTWYRKVEKTGHRFDYFYSAQELEEVASHVRTLAEAAESVQVAVNTNNSNQGPVNALALAEILELPIADSKLLGELRGQVGDPEPTQVTLGRGKPAQSPP